MPILKKVAQRYYTMTNISKIPFVKFYLLSGVLACACTMLWAMFASVVLILSFGFEINASFAAMFDRWIFFFIAIFAGINVLVRPKNISSIRENLSYIVVIVDLVLAFFMSILLTVVIGFIISIVSKSNLDVALIGAFRIWILTFVCVFIGLMFLINPARSAINQKRKMKRALVGYTFLAPNIIGFLVFTSLPVVASLLLSFCKWDIITGIDGIELVGLANFKKLLGMEFLGGAQHWWQYIAIWNYVKANDPNFWKYLWNTIFFMFGIPFGMAGSLFLAILLNRKIRGRVLFRTIYFLPSMCVPVAVFLLWRWLYNPHFGLINWLLGMVGINGPNWLSSMAWAKPAIMITGFWGAVGGPTMILYLAGLQGVPRNLYEAADIDGASATQKFRHITWPLLTPTTFFIFIMSIIGGFQGSFESAYMMTGGGPAGSTTAISFYIYNNAFRWFKMGYAASISWVLFLTVFIVTLINYKYGGKRVHYY